MIVTVVNQKGGVGKTTTSVNLAYVLARTRNVGLLDLDPEGGATMSFGMRRERAERELGAKSVTIFDVEVRSEERRVGKECRSRWSPYH